MFQVALSPPACMLFWAESVAKQHTGRGDSAEEGRSRQPGPTVSTEGHSHSARKLLTLYAAPALPRVAPGVPPRIIQCPLTYR